MKFMILFLYGVSLSLCCIEASSADRMVLIPSGWVERTSVNFGVSYVVNPAPLYMDATEITKKHWDFVYSWAITNGYAFEDALGKGDGFPVHNVGFYEALRWINARSEMQNLTPCYYTTNGVPYRKWIDGPCVCDFTRSGYRLPTISEWEYAAHGGELNGNKYPTGRAISQDFANICVTSNSSPLLCNSKYHVKFNDRIEPYTSPVASFVANGYGLYDMAGNVAEWCWKSSLSEDFKIRDEVLKGGSWFHDQNKARIDFSTISEPGGQGIWCGGWFGFRCVKRCNVQ